MRAFVDTTISLVDVDDCTEAHVLAAERGTPGERYVINGAVLSAREALEVARRVRPQIVLCDIGLPDVDGFRLVESLRRELAGSPVVFAAVTGYAGEEDQQRALAAGFDSFFVKPLNPNSLAKLLRSYAGRSG